MQGNPCKSEFLEKSKSKQKHTLQGAFLFSEQGFPCIGYNYFMFNYRSFPALVTAFICFGIQSFPVLLTFFYATFYSFLFAIFIPSFTNFSDSVPLTLILTIS